MLIQIKHRYSGIVLWEKELESLSSANLRGANLYGADLRGADLSSANLSSADLRGADLRGANLYGADLRGADLYGADLRGADLSSANLSSADLRGAIIDKKYGYFSISPIGSENETLWVMRNEEGILIYHRGCFSGTRDEFINAVNEKHADTKFQIQYMEAVKLIDMVSE